MKRLRWSALLVALLLGRGAMVPATAVAADAKTVAVVSIAGYDDIMSNLGMLGRLSGNPNLVGGLEATLNLMTQNQGLNGLDKKRPLGLVITSDGNDIQGVAFVPVTSLKQLFTSLGTLNLQTEDVGGGVMALQAGFQKVYLKEQNGWAFVGQSAESLGANLPADPGKLLDGLDKQYVVAMRVNVQNIPKHFRDMIVDQLKAGAEHSLEREPNEDDVTFEFRRKFVENQIKQFVTVVNETDQLTMGWALDQKAQSTSLDVSITAAPGSKMAKQFGKLESVTSDFAGFLMPDAAFKVNLSATVEPEEVDQALATFKTLKERAQKQIDAEGDLPDANAKKVAKEIIGELIDAMSNTLKLGKLDGAAAVILDEKKFTLIAGAAVADPKSVESALKKFVELAKNEPGFPGVQWNAESAGGISFHKMSLPVPPGDDAAKVFGNQLDVAVGIGPKAIYVAAGSDHMATLKKALTASSSAQKVAPLQATIALSSIFKFVAATKPDPITGMLSAELAKSAGKDHITLTIMPVPNGATYHVEAEEGVLKVLGQAASMAKGAAGIPGGF